MEMPVSKMRQTFSLNVCIRLILCLVTLPEFCTPQTLELARAVQILSIGPVPYMQCIANIPEGTTGHSIKWIYDGNELFVNEVKRADTSSRYHVTYMPHKQEPRTYVSQLSIYNAVKQDEGMYQCRVDYVEDNTVKLFMDDIFIKIVEYLPAETYPECSLKYTDHSFIAESVTFTCLVGDSNPSVTLKVALNRTNGSEISIGDDFYNGNASATIKVSNSENELTFVCYMTSDLFKTAFRTCSVGPINVTDFLGPITVLPKETPLTSSKSSSAKSHTVTPPHTSGEEISPSKTANASTWGIVGGVIGAFVASATFIIIMFMRRYYKTARPGNDSITIATVSNQSNASPSIDQQSADHEYTAYQRQPESEPYAALNQTNVPPSDQQFADHPYTAYQKQPDPEPYATLNQTNVPLSSDKQPADHPYTAYQRQPEPEPYALLKGVLHPRPVL